VFGLDRWGVIREVILPGSLPSALVGVRQALGIAWLSLVVAEQINADHGIGYLIMNARDFLRTDVIVVGLAVYALLGLGTDAIVRAIEHRTLRWRPRSSRRRRDREHSRTRPYANIWCESHPRRARSRYRARRIRRIAGTKRLRQNDAVAALGRLG